PSASMNVLNRIARRARSLNLPPRSTIVTTPSSFVPAAIAVRPSTVTSRVTLAVMRSSTRAVSDEMLWSILIPTTESALTVTSSKRGFGRSGTGGGSIAAVAAALPAAAVTGGGSTFCTGGGAVTAGVASGSDAGGVAGGRAAGSTAPDSRGAARRAVVTGCGCSVTTRVGVVRSGSSGGAGSGGRITGLADSKSWI